MHAQNTGITHDLATDMLDQFGVWCLAQKRAHRILDKLKAAPANIGANGKADPGIKIDIRHLRNNRTCQHSTRGKNIVLGILSRRMQRLGLNTVAELLVEGRHPQLNDHRKQQDRNQGKRELNWLGMDDAFNRGFD